MEPFCDLSNPELSCVSFPQELSLPSVLFSLTAGESQDKAPADWPTLWLESALRPPDVSIALFFVFHSLRSSEFNRGFDGSLGTILGGNLGDELPDGNVLELLPLLLVALVPLPRSRDRSRTALSGRRAGALGFNGRRGLFLPGTPSSTLLSITSSRLSL